MGGAYVERGSNDGWIIAIILIVLLLMVVGYFIGNAIFPNTTGTESISSDLAKIPGYDNLYYDVNTNTVYCLDKYISNGHECEYRNGKIVEVVEVEIVPGSEVAN